MRLGSVPGLDTEHLEREGWAVLRGVVDPAVCDRARGCIDGILGPAVAEVPVDGRGQTARWPDPAGLPLLSSGGPYRTKVMHPIRDGVTAELAAALAPIFHQLYGCKRPEDLKLLQQMFVRTDALPPEDLPGLWLERPRTARHSMSAPAISLSSTLSTYSPAAQRVLRGR